MVDGYDSAVPCMIARPARNQPTRMGPLAQQAAIKFTSGCCGPVLRGRRPRECPLPTDRTLVGAASHCDLFQVFALCHSTLLPTSLRHALLGGSILEQSLDQNLG